MLTFGSLFSGYGLADCGYKAAGLTPVMAVEIEPRLADVYRANHGDHITVADINDVDFKRLEKPDVLHISPSCKNASQANSGATETDADKAAAQASCRAIETWRPQAVILENVWLYRHFEAFGMILNTLSECGYFYEFKRLNAADFGVPQTRYRLILRAWQHGFLPPLPPKTKWRGWYEAIEDLIPELPDSRFAEWQLARIEKHFPYETFLHMTRATSYHEAAGGTGIKKREQPAGTVTPDSKAARAFMVAAGGYSGNIVMRQASEPSFTQTAESVGQQPIRAWLELGRVVKMTPRALGRFQTLPDDFVLSGHNALDCEGIGNGVPPLWTQALIADMIPQLKQEAPTP